MVKFLYNRVADSGWDCRRFVRDATLFGSSRSWFCYLNGNWDPG